MAGQVIIPAQASANVPAPKVGYVTFFVDAATGFGRPRFRFSDGSYGAFALEARIVQSGNGLAGGGDLSADRTLSVVAEDASIVVGAAGIKVGALTTDAQHGNRGGAALHTAAVSGGASGFMTGTDKATLDSLVTSVSSASGAAATALSVANAAGSAASAAQATADAAVPATRTVMPGAGLTGGGALSGNITLAVGVISDAQHGARGGGTLHANVISGGAAGFITGADKALLDALVAAPASVPVTRTVTAGAGLTGGGALSANLTLDVVANADGSIVVGADDVKVGVLATDAQHGTRAGGGLHANVVAAGAAGFMTGADKSKLDALPAAMICQRLNANATTTVVTATATNLSFPIAANEVWQVRVDITAQCSGTGGMKYAVGAPVGAVIEGWLQTSGATILTASLQRITAPSTLTATAAHTVAATPGPDSLTFTVANGATPGTVQVQIASVTAAQTTTVFAGSSLRATRATNV